MTERPYGTCDWGYCSRPAVAWRGDEVQGRLPVCAVHRLDPTRQLVEHIRDTLIDAKGYDFPPDTAEIRTVHEESEAEAVKVAQMLRNCGYLAMDNQGEVTK